MHGRGSVLHITLSGEQSPALRVVRSCCSFSLCRPGVAHLSVPAVAEIVVLDMSHSTTFSFETGSEAGWITNTIESAWVYPFDRISGATASAGTGPQGGYTPSQALVYPNGDPSLFYYYAEASRENLDAQSAYTYILSYDGSSLISASRSETCRSPTICWEMSEHDGMWEHLPWSRPLRP